MTQIRLLHFVVLALILMGGIGAFYYVRGDAMLQFWIGVVTSIAYVFWGIIHHLIQKDLHRRIVIEYLLIGAIAVVMLSTIIRS